MSETQAMRRHKPRYHNRLKVLGLFVLCWGAVALAVYAALRWLYPVKLAGTAPDIAATVRQLWPWLGDTLARAGLGRENLWRTAVGSVHALAIVVDLIVLLLWRASYARPVNIAKATWRARRGHRVVLMWLMVKDVSLGLLMWLVGVQFISGWLGWDYIVYFGGFPLGWLAAALCLRLGAPAAISGRHAYFKRL